MKFEWYDAHKLKWPLIIWYNFQVSWICYLSLEEERESEIMSHWSSDRIKKKSIQLIGYSKLTPFCPFHMQSYRWFSPFAFLLFYFISIVAVFRFVRKFRWIMVNLISITNVLWMINPSFCEVVPWYRVVWGWGIQSNIVFSFFILHCYYLLVRC